MIHEKEIGLSGVLDQLNQIRDLNEAAFMAALDLSCAPCRDAMRNLLDLISDKIDGAKSDLNKLRSRAQTEKSAAA
jgi:hypothetical protein